MHHPIVSIIVPVYNVEKYLEECVESLRNQTLKDIEIILVDDESPDNCPALCDQYAEQDPRIKVVHKMNGGLGFARNSGLEVATGEYVTFVDSDDYIDRDTYSYLLNKYVEEKPDVIYYKYVRFQNGDKTVSKKSDQHKIYRGNEIKSLMLNIIAAPVDDKRERCIECSSCTAIYHREILEKHQRRFHSERELISEDMVFNLDVLSISEKAVYDESVFYFYRINPNSLTKTIRMDRAQKTMEFSSFVRSQVETWGLPLKEALIRIARMTIGLIRSAVHFVIISSMEEQKKKYFFKQAVNHPELRHALKVYPWIKYSAYQLLYYWSFRLKIYGLSKLLSIINNKRKTY